MEREESRTDVSPGRLNVRGQSHFGIGTALSAILTLIIVGVVVFV